ncbi:hypothetical protein T439DRAFT_81625 [Meredithblackwellia eburnea MCA 4105]
MLTELQVLALYIAATFSVGVILVLVFRTSSSRHLRHVKDEKLAAVGNVRAMEEGDSASSIVSRWD